MNKLSNSWSFGAGVVVDFDDKGWVWEFWLWDLAWVGGEMFSRKSKIKYVKMQSNLQALIFYISKLF